MAGRPKTPRMVLGILGSGSGSNMQAILDAIAAGSLAARIALVLSDNPDAFILKRARRHGITTGLIDCRGFKTKFPAAAQEETAARLQAAGVDLVCLAGFLRLVKQPLLDAFPNTNSHHKRNGLHFRSLEKENLYYRVTLQIYVYMYISFQYFHI